MDSEEGQPAGSVFKGDTAARPGPVPGGCRQLPPHCLPAAEQLRKGARAREVHPDELPLAVERRQAAAAIRAAGNAAVGPAGDQAGCTSVTD